MLQSASERHQITVAVVALAVLAGACVQPGAPGVAIRAVQTDVVFGQVDKKPAPPPGFAPPRTPVLPESLPPTTVADLPSLDLPREPLPSFSECPEPALNEFPDEPASISVIGEPTETALKFRRTLKVTAGGRQQTSSGFEEHVVRSVVREGDHAFTFELVQPDPFDPNEVVTSTFLVNTNPNLLVNEWIDSRTLGNVDVPGTHLVVPETGDEAGIFLTKVVRTSVEGLPRSTFQPLTPVKYLPLDEGLVSPGQEFSTVAFDPTNGDVLVHEAQVLRRSRVNACGELVEGWAVAATQTFNNQSRTYLYTIATQEGGLIIAETTAVADEVAGVGAEADTHLADLTPLSEGDS